MSPVDLFSPVASVVPKTPSAPGAAQGGDLVFEGLLASRGVAVAEGVLGPSKPEEATEGVALSAPPFSAFAVLSPVPTQSVVPPSADGAAVATTEPSGSGVVRFGPTTPVLAETAQLAASPVAPLVEAPVSPVEDEALTVVSGSGPPQPSVPAVAGAAAPDAPVGESQGPGASKTRAGLPTPGGHDGALPPGLLKIVAEARPAAERSSGVPALAAQAAAVEDETHGTAAPSPPAVPPEAKSEPVRGAINASTRAVERAALGSAVARAVSAAPSADGSDTDVAPSASPSDGESTAAPVASANLPGASQSPPAVKSAATPIAAAVSPDAVSEATGDETGPSEFDFAALEEPVGVQTGTGAQVGGPTGGSVQPVLAQIGLVAAGTVAQLAAEIGRRLEGRSTRFELELHPADLGRVDVRLDVGKDGQVTAQLSFDNPLAAAELRSRADELRRSLEQAGFQLGQGALTFAERDPGGQGQGGERPARGRAFSGAAALVEAADAPVRRSGFNRSALDVRV